MRLLILAALIATPALATQKDLRSIAGMQFHNRVVISFAPHLADPRLRAQGAEMAKFGTGAAERDLLFVQVGDHQVLGASDKPEKLRRKFHVEPGNYRSILIGKDGNTAIEADAPIPAARLQAAIDAMPMRQDEVRRAQAGMGKQRNR